MGFLKGFSINSASAKKLIKSKVWYPYSSRVYSTFGLNGKLMVKSNAPTPI